MTTDFSLPDFCAYMDKVLEILEHTKYTPINAIAAKRLQETLRQMIPTLKTQAGPERRTVAVREYEKFISQLLAILSKSYITCRQNFTWQQAIAHLTERATGSFCLSLASLLSAYLTSINTETDTFSVYTTQIF